jgi:hypothetical protein
MGGGGQAGVMSFDDDLFDDELLISNRTGKTTHQTTKQHTKATHNN